MRQESNRYSYNSREREKLGDNLHASFLSVKLYCLHTYRERESTLLLVIVEDEEGSFDEAFILGYPIGFRMVIILYQV